MHRVDTPSDMPRSVVSVSVCVGNTCPAANCAETAESIDVSFRANSRGPIKLTVYGGAI